MSRKFEHRFALLAPALWLASIAVWFSVFPVKESFSKSDVLFEGIYLLAALISFFLVLRLGEWKLSFGWAALCEGLLFDFLDEFTLEAGFRLDVDAMQDIATTAGLLMMTLGFLSAAGRRERELDAMRESADALGVAGERLAAILESVSDGLIVTGVTEGVQLWNATALALVGRQPDGAMGLSITEFLSLAPENIHQIEDLRSDAFSHPMRAASGIDLLRQRDGISQALSVGVSAIKESGQATGLVWVIRDVTHRREEEKHISQASRLESVGLLAGGVAHDFNNLLSAVMNWVSFSEVTQAEGPELRETFQEITKACKRGKSLANQLLSFAKGGDPVVAPTDLSSLVQEEVVFALRGSKVSPVFFFGKGLPHAEVDAVQIGQVIQNLVINAKQAMALGGSLEVKVDCRKVTATDTVPLDPGDYLEVSIQDEGAGIAEEDRKHIFDPYFSKKESGSGLGLATAYAIIRRHRGHIWAEFPANREGTCFRVLLPKTSKLALGQSRTLDDRLFHGKSILAVDDDYSVQKPLVGTLKAIGFDVEACMRGEDAIHLYQRRLNAGNPFDLVLMDLTLQGEAGGAEGMKKILAIDPKAKGIVMSGYHEDPVMANYLEEGFCGVMQKPFDYLRMVAEMGRVLGQSNTELER